MFNFSGRIKVAHFFLLLLCFCTLNAISQSQFNVFISNSGNDSNAGTSPLVPKRTFNGSLPLLNKLAATGKVSIGLKAGDTFNDALTPSYPVTVGSYFTASQNTGFAVLNGSDNYNTGWLKAASLSNVFQQAIAAKGFSGEPVGGYNYIFVIEIDKELEKSSPLTARKLLSLAPSAAAADTMPASFYELPGVVDSIIVFIHTSDGLPPNLHPKYRYEVTVRNRAVNAYDHDDNQFENLIVRGYGAGYGSLPGGTNSIYNKIIFGPGAAVHHVVIKSGTINKSLFLPGAKNINGIAVTFYNVEGFSRRNNIYNSIFLDIRNAIYSHTSYGSNYGSVHLNNVIGFADSLEGGQLISTSDNDTVILNNVYTDKYTVGFNVGHNNISAKSITINNSFFKDVTSGIAFGSNAVNAALDNVFIRTNGKNNVAGVSPGSNTSLKLRNSIFHIKANGSTGYCIVGSGGTSNSISAKGNVFIGDTDVDGDVNIAVTNTDQGIGTSADKWSNNVYILLKGKDMVWNVTNGATNGGSNKITSFSEWKRQSGQDKNSLFFDLRNDPRGLKAIFFDPENGDYELALTPEGNQVRSLQAGMTNPITCFLNRPSYEEAASIIMNGQTLSANTCKSPCMGTAIRTATIFKTTTLNNSQTKIEWHVEDSKNIEHFEIERAAGNSAYSKIAETTLTTDSMYSVVDSDIQPNVTYRYRLVVVSNIGYKCYSPFKTVSTTLKDYSLTVFPNPSRGKIAVLIKDYSGCAELVITNVLGQKIFEKKVTIEAGVPQQLELKGPGESIYWLKVITPGKTLVNSFILK